MVQTIKIHKEYNIYDLGDSQTITELINKIHLEPTNYINLDLTNCLLDYPFTGKLFDKILIHLSKQNGKKKLTIFTDYILPYETTVNLLFLGSEFIGVNDNHRILEPEWDFLFNELIEKHQITISIKTYNKANSAAAKSRAAD